jgi:hypothetical protein
MPIGYAAEVTAYAWLRIDLDGTAVGGVAIPGQRVDVSIQEPSGWT